MNHKPTKEATTMLNGRAWKHPAGTVRIGWKKSNSWDYPRDYLTVTCTVYGRDGYYRADLSQTFEGISPDDLDTLILRQEVQA